jgi:hypothetical protein
MINRNGLNKTIITKSLLTKGIPSFHSNKVPFLKYLQNIMVDFSNLNMFFSGQMRHV